jgi:hypothetical protein
VSERILDDVLVLRFEPDEGFQQLNLLLHDQVVDLGQVLQARRAIVRLESDGWRWHVTLTLVRGRVALTSWLLHDRLLATVISLLGWWIVTLRLGLSVLVWRRVAAVLRSWIVLAWRCVLALRRILALIWIGDCWWVGRHSEQLLVTLVKVRNV